MAKVKCPSCGTAAEQTAPGEKIVCAGCGGSFTFVAGETKLAGVGEFDELKAEVGDLKAIESIKAHAPTAKADDTCATCHMPGASHAFKKASK